MIWQKVKIGSFLTERVGRYKPDEANSMNLKRIEKIDFNGNIHLIEGKTTGTDMILVKPGDLVISGINADKGAVSIYRGDEDVMATIHYSSYTFNEESIDIDYFKWFLRSKTFLKVLKAQSKGGIKTELKAKRLLPLLIDLPDIQGQEIILKKIESIEAEYEELLNSKEDSSNYLTKLKQSILQEAIQGKLTADWRVQNPNVEPASEILNRIKAEKDKLVKEKKVKKEKPLPPITEDEIPFELPNGWVWCRLGEICDNITAGSTPSKEHFVSDGIPYLKVYNIRNQAIDFHYKPQFINKSIHETALKRCILKPGDVIMNIVGPPLGKAAIIPNTYPEWNCNQAISIFRCIDPRVNQNIFLYLSTGIYLRTLDFKGMAGQDNISVTMCKNLLYPLPPLQEQKAITQKVEALMHKCQVLESTITQNVDYAQMLMQAVLKEAFEPSTKPVNEMEEKEIEELA